MEEKESTWFKEWFNTPYYSELYQNRDEEEAKQFISRLLDKLPLTGDETILDLACGAGRHSIYLNSLGFEVYGADISEFSIARAKAHSNDRLHFEQHDMRNPFSPKVDVVLNLFTSFGYFDDVEDNQLVLNGVSKSLKPGGYFLLDYLNADPVISDLPIRELKQFGSNQYHIHKYYRAPFIYKEIRVQTPEEGHLFREQVTRLSQSELTKMLEKSNFSVIDWFGNYELDEFDVRESPRLIVLAKLNG